MDWGTRIFWSLVAVLLGASVFFAQGAEAQRSLAKAAEATLETGDLVKVIQVVDGDSLVAAAKGLKWDSPRGPMSIDPQTRDVVQNIYIRKVEKVAGEPQNVAFDKIENVKDPAGARR